MIEDIINNIFKTIGHTWNISGRSKVPDSKDIALVLDEAVGRLYDSGIGTQFQTGGLVVEKAPKGFDVYVYVGNYK